MIAGAGLASTFGSLNQALRRLDAVGGLPLLSVSPSDAKMSAITFQSRLTVFSFSANAERFASIHAFADPFGFIGERSIAPKMSGLRAIAGTDSGRRWDSQVLVASPLTGTGKSDN